MPLPAGSFITLEAMHQHLRAPIAEDAGLIELYAGAACGYIREFTGVDWQYDEDDTEAVPPAVRVAALMLVADLYENREAQSPVPLSANKTVDRLLWPHRVWS